MIFTRLKFLLLYNLLFLNFVEAQSFKKIGVQDGLPSSIIYDIKIDESNRVWLATFGGGIACYDGIKFKVLNQDNGLSNDLIRCLALDEKNKRIYAGSQGALDVITKNTVTNVSKQLNDTSEPNVLFVKFLNNAIYVSTQDGLLKIENNKRTEVAAKIPAYSFFNDDDGNMWLPNRNGLNIILANGLLIDVNKYFNLKIDGATDVKKFGGYTVVSSRTGLHLFHKLNYIKTITKANGLPEEFIRCMLVDGNKLWLGTKTGLVVTSDLEHFSAYGPDNGIDNCEIKCMAIDKNGLLWIGSSTNGLFKMIKSNIVKYTLPSPALWFAEDKLRNLYVLTKNRISKFSIDSNKFIYFRTLNDASCRNFCIDNSDNIYVISDSREILKLSPKNEKKHLVYQPFIPDNIPFAMVHSENAIWLEYKRGILKYNYLSDKLEKVGLSMVQSTFFQDIKKQNENIWFTSDQGVNKISGTTVKEFANRTLSSFPLGIANKIMPDKYNHVWVATDKGLVCLEEEKNVYTNFRKNGFITNEIADLAVVDTFLFVATNKGLVQINIQKSHNQNCTYQVIDNKNGLKEYDLTGKAIFSDSTSVWIAAENGAYRYNPSNQLNLNIPIYITNVTTDSSSLVFPNSKNYTNELVDINKELKLTYKQNDFHIEFNGINYHQFDNVYYTYRLIGLNENWSAPSIENKAVYTNLNPGDYVFQISLSNGKTKFGPVVKYKINITSPFYKTIWFILLLIIFGIALVYIIFRIRLRSVKFKNLLLERRVEERTLQLNTKTQLLSKTNAELSQKSKLITESLEYAKKIQESILPSQQYLNEQFKNLNTGFLYIPKDIVSGDFFYTNIKNNINYFAVVDCTGHGVPGALLSFSINSILHGIIENVQGFEFPSIIIKELLKKFGEIYIKGQDVKESFAISLVVFNTTNQKLYISTISQSVLLSGSDGMKEVKNTSSFLIHKSETIKDIEQVVSPGDRLFLYSDGYYDQKNDSTKKRMYKSRMINEINITLRFPLNQQINNLHNYYIAYKGEHEQIDDVTVFGIEFV